MSCECILSVTMLRCLVLLALAAASALPATAQHDAEDDDRPPFELLRPRPGDGPYARYVRLLEAAPGHPARTQGRDFVRQYLAQEAGALGDH